MTATTLSKPNIIVLMTDQERAVQHWPAGWDEASLPAMQRLRARGLTFKNAITNTCQCSPSRATLHTSTYPSEHGVTTTFGTGPGLNPRTLDPRQNNLARVLDAAGYHVAYKGKWHLTRPLNRAGIRPGTWTDKDISILRERFGYADWNPPDSGNSLGSLKTLGAGKAQHDRRYLHGRASKTGGKGYGQSVFSFLKEYNEEKPFCLFVSLVNPHDIFVYPRKLKEAGFKEADFKKLPIELPASFNEDLESKPVVQQLLRYYFERIDPVESEAQALNYVRFYAWLHTVVDKQIGELLDLLDSLKLTENTLILRISDHGEMGMAHGGLRQKEYNCYEETIRVPFVVSNPVLFPQARQTNALAGLIDILPTLAAVAGAPERATNGLRGVDLSPVLDDPETTVQDVLHFTYDDDFLPEPRVPGFIRALRTERWKYAVYFDPINAEFEYELYDLQADPLELRNLAHPKHLEQAREKLTEMHKRLFAIMQRNQTVPQTVEWPDQPDPSAMGFSLDIDPTE